MMQASSGRPGETSPAPESSLVRPPDRRRILPWKIRVKVLSAPAAQRGRTTLTVIFARRQDARREEDGPAALAGRGAAGALRRGPPGGGYGAAVRRQWPTPVRCRARGSGPDCRPGYGEGAPPPSRLPCGPLSPVNFP